MMGISAKTLKNRRSARGENQPEWYPLGRNIWYRRSEVERWREQQRRGPRGAGVED